MNDFPDHKARDHQDWMTGVFERYERPLVSYSRSLLRGDLELARDVVQDSFVRLCKEPWPEIESRVEGWLFLVCRNRCLDLLKRWETRMHTTMKPEHWQGQSDGKASDPSLQAEQAEQKARLKHSLDDLSPRQQEVLRLKLHQGMSYQQIADATGSSVASVGFHLHEALKALRRNLQEA